MTIGSNPLCVGVSERAMVRAVHCDRTSRAIGGKVGKGETTRPFKLPGGAVAAAVAGAISVGGLP